MRQQVQFRLLVVRLGAMGDILHALPAVTALRRAHPSWKIDWVVEPQWLPLLSAEPNNAELGAARGVARPVVDQIHLAPTKAWGRNLLRGDTLNEIRSLRTEMRAAEYDAVLDLQGAIRSAALARLTGCKRIVGEASPRELPASWLSTERVRTETEHVIEQGLELACALAGDVLPYAAPVLPIDLDAEDWCDRQPELKEAQWRESRWRCCFPVAAGAPSAGRRTGTARWRKSLRCAAAWRW